ncbi:hypothetical protein [Hydrotalea sp.]|uniref:hypothetical protein n=1 Tax=Hydrotalea sp. TaxID=2881279 RepID=UPI00261E18C2|nr:hypothetical protein [Hydrotalea sp.]
MKYIIIKIFVIVTFFAAIFACKKTFIINTPYQVLDSSMAYLKIVHASPFFRRATGAQDTFNVFVGNIRLNNTPFLTYNGIFPNAVNPTSSSITNTYMAVPAGLQQFHFSIPGVLNQDSVQLFSFSKKLNPGSFYTLLITDSMLSKRDSSKIFIQDIFSTPLQGNISLRFIHAVLNDTAGKTVDVFSYARNATILTKITPDSATAFQTLGYNTGVIDTFYVTRSLATGQPSNTPLANRTILAKLPFATNTTGAAPQRVFTLYYKGDANTATGKKPRTIASYINQ